MDTLFRMLRRFKIRYRMWKERHTAVIRISNLTKPQVEAIESLMAQWVSLGGLGGSRWTAFYADGDGNFRPRITVNGRKAQFTEKLNHKKLWVSADDLSCGSEIYAIDFDAIAWQEHVAETPVQAQEEAT